MRNRWQPVAVAWSLALCAVTSGQTPVDFSARTDANPSLFGRMNAARPTTPLMSGNLFATGNVRGGLSLRSVSPIPSVFEFRGSLGSGNLSNFIRDSYSVADAQRAQLGTPRATVFYDPSTTVPNVGYLRSRAPSTPLDMRIRQGAGDPRLPGMLSYSGPTGQLDDLRIDNASDLPAGIRSGALRSPIFGPQNFLPETAPPSYDTPPLPSAMQWRIETPSELDSGQGRLGGAADRPDQSTALSGEPLDFRVPLDRLRVGDTRVPAATADDLLTRMADRRLPRTPRAKDGERERDELTTVNVPQLGEQARRTAARQNRLSQFRAAGLLPGQDVYTDMRLADALAEGTGADLFSQVQAAIRENPTLAQELQEYAEMNAREFVERVRRTPLSTLASGDADKPLNQMLQRAEGQMDTRQFADAARTYRAAASLAPRNPLPDLGLAHANLALGDYNQAANFLMQALEKYPHLAERPVDLKALIGDPEMIDIRRADLMDLLARRPNDARLRFLLGYIEYHGGLRERGLENLRRAARDARFGSIIERYPALLTGAAGEKTPTTETPAGS